MFFNKTEPKKVGELTAQEKVEFESLSTRLRGLNNALLILSSALGELENEKQIWWDDLSESHEIQYNKEVETLSIDECGNINKSAK